MTAVDRKSIASPLDKTWTSSHSLEYQHPLDPLSPAEIARAVALIKSQCAKEISDSHTFTSVCLLEPPRDTLWNYEHLLLPHERVHALHKMDRRAIGCDVCLLVLPLHMRLLYGCRVVMNRRQALVLEIVVSLSVPFERGGAAGGGGGGDRGMILAFLSRLHAARRSLTAACALGYGGGVGVGIGWVRHTQMGRVASCVAVLSRTLRLRCTVTSIATAKRR